MVPWAQTGPYPKRHLERFSRFWFSRFCRAQDLLPVTYTDHTTLSVTIGHIYIVLQCGLIIIITIICNVHSVKEISNWRRDSGIYRVPGTWKQPPHLVSHDNIIPCPIKCKQYDKTYNTCSKIIKSTFTNGLLTRFFCSILSSVLLTRSRYLKCSSISLSIFSWSFSVNLLMSLCL